MTCPLHHRSHCHRYYCHASIAQTPCLICNSCYWLAWRYSSSTIAAVLQHRLAQYLLYKSSSWSSEESPTWFELEGEQSSLSASKFHRPCFLSYSYPMPIQIPPFETLEHNLPVQSTSYSFAKSPSKTPSNLEKAVSHVRNPRTVCEAALKLAKGTTGNPRFPAGISSVMQLYKLQVLVPTHTRAFESLVQNRKQTHCTKDELTIWQEQWLRAMCSSFVDWPASDHEALLVELVHRAICGVPHSVEIKQKVKKWEIIVADSVKRNQDRHHLGRNQDAEDWRRKGFGVETDARACGTVSRHPSMPVNARQRRFLT